MNIALVVVLGGDLVRSTEHLGIGYIAAYLRKNNHIVTIFEINDINKPECYEKLLEPGFSVYGFTTTCVTMSSILKVAEKIKSHHSEAKIVFGGHMATFSATDLLEQYDMVDAIIYGEGEEVFCEYLDCLEKNQELSEIKGLYYKADGKIFINEPRALMPDIDILPFPARDQFEQHNGEFQYLRVSTSRGCYGSCGFCSNFVGRKQQGQRWRGRSPKNIVDEIEGLCKKYSFYTYDFVDSTFEDPLEGGKGRIRKIAEEILNRNLSVFYNCCFRAENWSDQDKDLLSLLVEAGLEKVNIGFEAGNDRGLKILNKRASVVDNNRAIKILSEFPDIYVTFGFIMLHPYSSLEDLKDNARFLYNTGIGQVIRHYFWILEVYPDTLMEKMLKRDNLLKCSYRVEDGMYQYKYQNSEVEVFKPIFTEMLTLNSVWDFEIFDILIHTFITRLRRKYKNDVIFDSIEQFRHAVNEKRSEIAGFNYQFFMDIVSNPLDIDINEKKQELDGYLLSCMEDIKSKQYQFGLHLLRLGYELNIGNDKGKMIFNEI